ncbi:toxin glutamine deamidase domain-containing protein [Actinacidiphila sp. DG2A-62]|uniref:toxin glutamine deamidase domain-containing protein n=1 Tax=Actinacidiphila sp. DG2A-62 TaxID=3108821 RepID=UPI002DB9E350|nr:toxin glutamine deamidase domain-containing protein [Actinacidiphila sp. DG2A-62]MEC3992106.1 toxin glutamine deamidase domain-containing protein [Actinacidiphila sp. DG2A-62]MEC3998879.1 toxin glutamine deamidase domain-containing protein [Actinacidiphila sp. DG2A-62]
MINPDNGYSNCVLCTLAGDDLIAGRPVKPAPGGVGPYDRDYLEAATGRTFVKEAGRLSQVVKDVLGWGSGGRGFIAVWPQDGVGHVFNVVNVDGSVVFLDYQLGKAKPTGWARYEIMRTD